MLKNTKTFFTFFFGNKYRLLQTPKTNHFFSRPMFDELQLQIFSYLSIEDLVRFDTALSCKEGRALYLDMIQQHKFWQFHDFAHYDLRSVSWMANRNCNIPKGRIGHFLTYFPFREGSLLFTVIESHEDYLKEADKLTIVKYLVEKTNESLEYFHDISGSRQYLIELVISRKYESIFDFMIERLPSIHTHYEEKIQPSERKPLLETAVNANSLHMVSRLLEMNADVNDYFLENEVKDELALKNNITNYGTALTNAAKQKNREIAEVLLNAGADIERKVRIERLKSSRIVVVDHLRTYVSPLAFACSNADIDMVRYLMDRGASIHGVACIPKHDMDTIFHRPKSINMLVVAMSGCGDGKTVDMVNEVLALLIANPKNEEFNSYEYFIAIKYALVQGLISVMVHLLSLCPNHEEVCHIKDESEKITLLMCACTQGNVDAILELLKAGSDPCDVDDHGRSSLQRYINSFSAFIKPSTAGSAIVPMEQSTDFKISSQVIKSLIANGTELSSIDLNNATLMNRLNVVQICCENGINPNLQSSAGNTAVHTAAMMNKPEILEELLKHGGDPCMKNDGGETSLHLAIRHDRIKCFQIIMRNIGTLPNNNGMDEQTVSSVLKEAAEYGSTTTLNELLAKSTISQEQLNNSYTRIVSLRQSMEVMIKANPRLSNGLHASYMKKENIFKQRGAVLTVESHEGILMTNDKGEAMPVQQAITQECCIS